MNGQIIPITYDDFYKFVTSLGLLTVVFSLYSLAKSVNLLLIVSLAIGLILTWWAGNRWYKKQQIRDRLEELQLEKEALDLEKKKRV